MTSSVILSPHLSALPTVPEPAASSARRQRSSARTTHPRRTRDSEPRQGHSNPSSNRHSVSPVPTASTSMSTQSRRSFSRSMSRAEKSPEKGPAGATLSISHHGPNTPTRGSRSTRNSSASSQDVAVLGLQLGEDIDSVDTEEAAAEAEVAADVETEVDVKPVIAEHDGSKDDEGEEGGNDADDQDGTEFEPPDSPIKTESVLRRDSTLTPEPEPEPEPEVEANKESRLDEPAKKNVIRLVLSRKRKAEEAEPLDFADPAASVSERESAQVSGAEDNGNAELDKGDEGKDGDDKQLQEEQNLLDAARRIPRKKRKWLKKGEVDPDDPVAVARQQQKFKMIDEALESLDTQFDQILAETHPQLLELWDELERRRDKQLLWLQQRYDAELGDLKTMCDHDTKVHKSDWKDKRDALADELILANRHAMSHISAERASLRRNPAFLPSLRAGRGAGGWNFSDKGLLSTGEQPLRAVQADGQWKQRRALPDCIDPLSYDDIQVDLRELGIHPNSRSSSPEHRPYADPFSVRAPPSRTSRGTRPDTKPQIQPSRTHPAARHLDEYPVQQRQLSPDRPPTISHSHQMKGAPPSQQRQQIFGNIGYGKSSSQAEVGPRTHSSTTNGSYTGMQQRDAKSTYGNEGRNAESTAAPPSTSGSNPSSFSTAPAPPPRLVAGFYDPFSMFGVGGGRLQQQLEQERRERQQLEQKRREQEQERQRQRQEQQRQDQQRQDQLRQEQQRQASAAVASKGPTSATAAPPSQAEKIGMREDDPLRRFLAPDYSSNSPHGSQREREMERERERERDRQRETERRRERERTAQANAKATATAPSRSGWWSGPSMTDTHQRIPQVQPSIPPMYPRSHPLSQSDQSTSASSLTGPKSQSQSAQGQSIQGAESATASAPASVTSGAPQSSPRLSTGGPSTTSWGHGPSGSSSSSYMGRVGPSPSPALNSKESIDRPSTGNSGTNGQSNSTSQTNTTASTNGKGDGHSTNGNPNANTNGNGNVRDDSRNVFDYYRRYLPHPTGTYKA